MRKIWFVFFVIAVICFWGCSNKAPANVDELISKKEIYVFIQRGCRHCLAAEKYLEETYPNLKVNLKDIAKEENRTLFFACGAKFGLSKFAMGTPLFCMGDHYIMGWGPEEQIKFDTYVKNFLPKK